MPQDEVTPTPEVFDGEKPLPPYRGPVLTPLQYEVLCWHAISREYGVPLAAIRSGFVAAPASAGGKLRHQIDLYWTSSDGVCEFLVFANAKWRKGQVALPDLMTLIGVKHDINAQKAMMITNSAYSSGVLAQAREKGIALLIVRPVEDFDAGRVGEFPTKAVVAQLELVASERRSPVYQIHIVHRGFTPGAAGSLATSAAAGDLASGEYHAVPPVVRVPAPRVQIVGPGSIPNKMISSSPPAPRGAGPFGIRRK